MARRARGPATQAIVTAVNVALTDADTAVLVACSGGPDSLALAAATQTVARRRGLASSAVVVDHGLQQGSSQAAATARDQLVRLGFADVAVVPVEVDARSGRGLEAAAREARYRALEAEAVTRQAVVLLGHTRDDQAETVLLALARGSGTRSLAGMAVRTGQYLRPLLSLPRTTTIEACTELGLTPWSDPHNTDDAYARSRVRARVLPLLEAELGPGIAASLARTAQLARDDADLLDTLAAQAHPGTPTLDCELLGRMPAALRRRVIRGWLIASGAPEATFVHVKAVEDLVTNWQGQGPTDVAGLQVRRVVGRLHCIS